MTIYMSKYDKALGISQFLTRRQRLGQLWGGKGGELHPQGRQAIEKLRDQISFINVSSAEGADTGTGHGYFRSSPWASSDILMTIYYGLTPKERGLIIQKDFPVFTFPTDIFCGYGKRSRMSILNSLRTTVPSRQLKQQTNKTWKPCQENAR